mmetsp:Transcript_101430/g.217198  ORF Transcript_101430/g.217198 Transcript_101430/m.217198 type:complete len:279 (-) Transcript_101430:128-964(-)
MLRSARGPTIGNYWRGAMPGASITVVPVEIDCAICLGAKREVGAQVLPCGHTFCRPCLERHVDIILRRGHAVWCPVCRQELSIQQVAVVAPFAAARIAVPPPPRPVAMETEDAGAVRRFRRIAQRMHLKKCPRCGYHIQKNGGCVIMRCICGHRFNWHDAETVVPCRQVHLVGDFRKLFFVTCRGCSPVAQIKLRIARTGVMCIGLPAGIITVLLAMGTIASLAATIVVVPMVTCAPLACAYEVTHPCCLLSARKRNPYISAMWSGTRLLKRLTRRLL